MIQFLITFFCLIFLIVLHEFSHFLAAKKSGVKVEEFGIGYPPRLIGKRIGDTFYSLNLILFGAFVKLKGETEELKEEGSFFSQPISKRIIIALAGVFSFWIISFLFFSLLFFFGNRVSIADEEKGNLILPKVQVLAIAKNSPAEIAGLRIGDAILKIKGPSSELDNVNKIKEIQDFTKKHLGEELILTVERGKKIFEIKIIPRISPPEGEGPMGVFLVRTAIKKYSFFSSIFQGAKQTFLLTLAVIEGYFIALKNIFQGLPSGVEMVGPIGIFNLAYQASEMGFVYFFNFLALISIYLAVFNALPIPALDGGKVLFLLVEKLRKKPISPKFEEKINAFFFFLLILLAIFVTIKDIAKILRI